MQLLGCSGFVTLLKLYGNGSISTFGYEKCYCIVMQNVYISYLFSQKTHPEIDVFHKTKSKNQAIPMVLGL